MLEILLVLVILAFAVGVVVPRVVGRMPGHELDAATALVAQAIEMAQLRAVSERLPVIISFDAARRVALLDGRPATGVWPVGISVTASPARLRFEPDYGGSGGVVLLQAGSLARRLAVDPLTGRARAVTDTGR